MQHLLNNKYLIYPFIYRWMDETDRQSYKHLDFIYPSIHTILCHRSNDRIDGWMDYRPTTPVHPSSWEGVSVCVDVDVESGKDGVVLHSLHVSVGRQTDRQSSPCSCRGMLKVYTAGKPLRPVGWPACWFYRMIFLLIGLQRMQMIRSYHIVLIHSHADLQSKPDGDLIGMQCI